MYDDFLDTPPTSPTPQDQGPLPPHLDFDLIDQFCNDYLPATDRDCTHIFTKSSLRDHLGARRETINPTLDPLPAYLDALKSRGFHWRPDPDLHEILQVKDNIEDAEPL